MSGSDPGASHGSQLVRIATLTGMTPERRRELERLADLNLVAMVRHRMRTTAGARLGEEDGVLLYSVGRSVASAHLNGVLRLEPRADAATVLARARRFFSPSRVEVVIWVRDRDDADLEAGLRDAGLVATRDPGIPCMFIERPFDDIAPPEDIDLRRVEDIEDAQDYARVVTTAFELEEEVARAVFAGRECLLAPHVAAFVARHRGVPVAAALALRAGEVAGLYYVGTVPEARGRRLGELCTRAATNAGLDMGARTVVLQASIMGEPLYRKMGYELLRYYRWYRTPVG
jgi:GNAT superfamily N-acetyltransferase